jgi:hypothetical protein
VNLRDLDREVLPRIAGVVQRLFRRDVHGRLGPTGPAPFILQLRRLDDRHASSGALGFLREVPQLGALLIAVLLLGSGGIVLQRMDRTPADDTVAVRDSPKVRCAADAPDGTALGAPFGVKVKTYVAQASGRLTALAKTCPTATRFAVVSLRSYVTPADAGRLLAEVTATEVSFRVPGGGAEQMQAQDAPVRAFRTDAEAAFKRAAQAEQKEADKLINSSESQSLKNSPLKSDRVQYAYNQQQIALHQQRARALRGNCACVFSMTVEGTVRNLVALRRMKAVRLVDPLPVTLTADQILSAEPLWPEDKVTVVSGNKS